MSKTYIIIAYDGAEIIDDTSNAESRINAMDYLEHRYIMDKKRRIKRRKQEEARRKAKREKNPLWKIAAFCGMS